MSTNAMWDDPYSNSKAVAVFDRADTFVGLRGKRGEVIDLAYAQEIAAPGGSELVGFKQSGIGAVDRTGQDKLRERVSVKDFGALGDGTGRTPADDGVDISTAAWNTWDGTPFKDNLPYSPYGTGGTFNPPRSKPFANDDTWDYIGITLAMWRAGKILAKAHAPAGTYVINLSSTTAKGAYNGLVIMKGMEQVLCGDGPYATRIIPKENAAFFAANSAGVPDAYKLLTLYRVGGPPTHVMEMAFIGPTGYTSASGNLSLIHCANINGVTLRDLWLSSAHRGVSANTNSGDSHIKGVTSEFLFGQTVYTDATSEFSIDFCNFWASASITGQAGVLAEGSTAVTNSRFIEFDGAAVQAKTGIFTGNTVTNNGTLGAGVSFTDECVVTGNEFSGDVQTQLLLVVKNASIVGNKFNTTSSHPCINMGDRSGGSATNIVITGNTFINTNAASDPQNYAILAIQGGVGYTGAATASCLIASNTFQGRALSAVGSATMSRNTFDGVLQAAFFSESVTLAGGSTHNGSTVFNGDVLGKEIMTGSGNTNPFTINVTGLMGIGQGGERDQQRLNLVSVYAIGPSFVGSGFALYTSKFDGTAVLIATLGSQSTGGSITFGTSGNNPTVTVNNSGGTVNYKINAVALI